MVSFPKGLHSWSSEQRRYDHPAMKMIKKAKRSRRETCNKWSLYRIELLLITIVNDNRKHLTAQATGESELLS